MPDYSKIKELINDADAILIGAGAGLSTSAGIDYGSESFKKYFPELVVKYGMTDMYTSSFYEFNTEEERWSYWAKHINHIYNTDVKKTYIDLYNIVNNKNYFVITTNVDGQFLKSGFAHDKVFEIQGSLAKIQCSVGCHDKLYDDLDMVDKMLRADKDCKVPSDLVPYCPRCGEAMEVNLRKDAFFVEDNNWHKQNKAYEDFVNKYKNKKLVLIELGVGFNTPGIIRFPFEKMTHDFKDTTLIRINSQYADLAFELRDRAILVKDDCSNVIKHLVE